jgi:uncharacterized coiled-coil protein SlyX
MNDDHIRSEAMLRSQAQQIAQYSSAVTSLEGAIAVLQSKLEGVMKQIDELKPKELVPAPVGAQPEGASHEN